MQAFGDGFDLYSGLTDPSAGYWDSQGTTIYTTFPTGRFANSRGLALSNVTNPALIKSSGSNDTIHHITVAYFQASATSAANGYFITLGDGATAQCTIVFRGDGSIQLQSGTIGGTVLATYNTAYSMNVWSAFEFEVVINNTTGSFTARKNGNTANDFTLGSLNTRGGTANNYANRVTIGMGQNLGGIVSIIDDFLWRSDPTSVPWAGDIRCYTRMPQSDVSAQWTRSTPTVSFTPVPQAVTSAGVASQPIYTPFTAIANGAIGSGTWNVTSVFTGGNVKFSIFSNNAGVPGAVLGSATPLVAPPTGTSGFTFPTPVTVVKGTQYWIGMCQDINIGQYGIGAVGSGLQGTTAYASFPVANPASLAAARAVAVALTITVSDNSSMVSEAQEDGTTTYVSDSTVGHADFYTVQALGGVASGIVCVTTRGFFEKSDVTLRGASIQIKSGATTAQATPQALGTNWGWVYRTDLTDPNTSAAWTAAAVDAAQIGPIVTS